MYCGNQAGPCMLRLILYFVGSFTCTFTILDETNRLHLKINPTIDEPPSVEDYHVPIFTCTKEDIEEITWDLTIEQVCIVTFRTNTCLKSVHQSDVHVSPHALRTVYVYMELVALVKMLV